VQGSANQPFSLNRNESIIKCCEYFVQVARVSGRCYWKRVSTTGVTDSG